MTELKIIPEHSGKLKINAEEHGFNSIVIALHPFEPDFNCVGRLVQVRKNSGAYGSDTIIIRLINGDLQSWENQGFFSVSDDFKEYYESLFKDLELDEENREYSICNKHFASGFVVEGMDCTDGKIYTSLITVSKTKNTNAKQINQ